MTYNLSPYESPVGPLLLVGRGEELCGVIFAEAWPKFKTRFANMREEDSPILQTARRQLDEYFEGGRQRFELPLFLCGTEFQKKAWNALAAIPFGETKTYKEQAALVASPKAFRAVGRANGLNPLSIVLPCHRVVGSDGKLTGYSGGIIAKTKLLQLEKGLPL